MQQTTYFDSLTQETTDFKFMKKQTTDFQLVTQTTIEFDLVTPILSSWRSKRQTELVTQQATDLGGWHSKRQKSPPFLSWAYEVLLQIPVVLRPSSIFGKSKVHVDKMSIFNWCVSSRERKMTLTKLDKVLNQPFNNIQSWMSSRERKMTLTNSDKASIQIFNYKVWQVLEKEKWP